MESLLNILQTICDLCASAFSHTIKSYMEYIYVSLCVCMCACVNLVSHIYFQIILLVTLMFLLVARIYLPNLVNYLHTHTHTHTHKVYKQMPKPQTVT